VFSTITSPAFSELVIVVVDDLVGRVPLGIMLFETLRELNEVRPFKLVFLFMGPHPGLGEARRAFEKDLDSVIAGGHFDFFDSPPTIRIT